MGLCEGFRDEDQFSLGYAYPSMGDPVTDKKEPGMEEIEVEKGLVHIGVIVKKVLHELAENSTERSESARGLPPVPPSDRGGEAEALCGILAPSFCVGSGFSE